MSGPTVTHAHFSDAVVVAVAGELDFAAVRAVAATMEPVLAAVAGRLVLDLSATTFLDSAGIGLLYDVQAAMTARGVDVRLVVPPGSLISRSLELTGADASLQIHATVQDAGAGEPPA